ncbi:hypothetical protein TURU_066090 [Turdus rufiventris]|nr:hypothetical protein TURU_066090 [Turdus rufiventris]
MSGVRTCKKSNYADTKGNEERGASGIIAEIPLQPMVKQADPLQPMEDNRVAEIHPQPMEEPHARAATEGSDRLAYVGAWHLASVNPLQIFCKQLKVVSQLLALFLMQDFNLPHVCWKLNTAERKQSRKFLECAEENFPTRLLLLLEVLYAWKSGKTGAMLMVSGLGLTWPLSKYALPDLALLLMA